MPNVKIFVDTSADMSEEMIKQYDLGVLGLLSIFGETTYVPGKNLTNEEFYKKLGEAKTLPKTAQTPYMDMYDALSEAAEQYDTVIYFTISSKASGQNHTANLVREEILEKNPNADIRIVDTMTFSVFIAATAIHAAKLLKEGMDVDAVLKDCESYIKTWDAYMLVDSLHYLEKGGRIKKAEAVVGSLLDIRPVLTVRDGLIAPVEKIRGKKKIYEKLIALIQDNPQFDAEKQEFIIIHSELERGLEFKEKLQEEFGVEELLMFSEFGPVVGTHIGPGCLAVAFRIKQD